MKPGSRGELRARIAATVEARAPQLIRLSHELHGDPELGGEEHRAKHRIAQQLADAGFVCDERQPSAPTALAVRRGNGALTVVCCIEVDALPDIGHACGHNVNAAAALGAALALADIAEEADLTVSALVTPAEETSGGKIDLIREGFLDGAHIALMAHASGSDSVGNSSLAMTMWSFEYTGRAAHCAAAPSEGVNALDAAVIAQTSIALARQQLPSGSIVSVVIDEGGSAVNVIPERTRGRVEMRAPTREALETITARIRKCLQAGALATDCALDIAEPGNSFSQLEQDEALCLAYQEAMVDRGRTVAFSRQAVASTDFGNVSLIVPSLHPMIGYEVGGAAHHTAEFAAHGSSESADRAVQDAAYGLAVAALSVASDPVERERLLR
ncbi:amidohydrolase [Leucobacter sp. wl10]|uniref:amidohydrolase n=1 Tax=Leucobacter sp. wl10 TaxID=2304677 RepID=UPI0013C2DF25|nr:amidohydrolase [Leucobacter sp. wl10]